MSEVKNIGNRLKTERERTGLSAEEFALIGGVGKATQYNYEKGLRSPDAEYFSLIAKLGCDIQFIITGNRSINAIKEEENLMLKLFSNADPVTKNLCIKMLS